MTLVAFLALFNLLSNIHPSIENSPVAIKKKQEIFDSSKLVVIKVIE
jgi:hypothetical protein